MKRAEDACTAGTTPTVAAASTKVTLRALYADAMKEVMADPGRAIAEHDPWLAGLLGGAAPLPAKR